MRAATSKSKHDDLKQSYLNRYKEVAEINRAMREAFEEFKAPEREKRQVKLNRKPWIIRILYKLFD